MKRIRLLRVFLFVRDLENTRDYEIESANGIEIRGVLEEKGEKVKITLFGKLEVPGDKVSLEVTKAPIIGHKVSIMRTKK